MNHKPVKILELEGEFTAEEISRFKAKVKEAMNASPLRIPVLYADKSTYRLQLFKRENDGRPET